MFALQRDDKYYQDPEQFNPDRFNEENSSGTHQLNRPFFAFGDGPRNCIGMRMGQMQVEAGLVLMLQKFRFELDETIKHRHLTFDPKTPVLASVEKILLKIFKR